MQIILRKKQLHHQRKIVHNYLYHLKVNVVSRLLNTPSIDDEQQEVEFNDTRLSDVLGYLRMYQNDNRIQFNSLQFNDREDLQVRKTN